MPGSRKEARDVHRRIMRVLFAAMMGIFGNSWHRSSMLERIVFTISPQADHGWVTRDPTCFWQNDRRETKTRAWNGRRVLDHLLCAQRAMSVVSPPVVQTWPTGMHAGKNKVSPDILARTNAYEHGKFTASCYARVWLFIHLEPTLFFVDALWPHRDDDLMPKTMLNVKKFVRSAVFARSTVVND